MKTDFELRILEIKYYLVIAKLNKQKQIMEYDMQAMLEALYIVARLPVTQMNIITNSILTPRNKPQKWEIVLFTRQVGIPVRRVQKLFGISNPTYYRNLEKIKDKPQWYKMTPKFTNEIHALMERFLTSTNKLLGEMLEVMNYD